MRALWVAAMMMVGCGPRLQPGDLSQTSGPHTCEVPVVEEPHDAGSAAEYYESFYSARDFKERLRAKLKATQKPMSYRGVWEGLSYTDEDPDEGGHVITLYSLLSKSFADRSGHSGSRDPWNREHVWPKSFGIVSSGKNAHNDLHHLRPSLERVNSLRSNYKMAGLADRGEPVRGAALGTKVDHTQGLFQPCEGVQGDIARMIFYMALRYGPTDRGTFDGKDSQAPLQLAKDLARESSYFEGGHFGFFSDLLTWHELDPVDAWERRRNQRVFETQGNRNPFIDHPEWVRRVWP